MWKTILGIILSISIASPTFCDEQAPEKCYPITKNDLKKSGAPLFSDYPVNQTTLETYAHIDLRNNSRAKIYQTVLKNGISLGPNFAGNYAVVGWSCGSTCVTFAAVNLLTGKVVFPEGINGVVGNHVMADDFAPEGKNSFWGLRYRLDSNLLIVIGMINEDKHCEGAFYYKLENDEFKEIFNVTINKELCENE